MLHQSGKNPHVDYETSNWNPPVAIEKEVRLQGQKLKEIRKTSPKPVAAIEIETPAIRRRMLEFAVILCQIADNAARDQNKDLSLDASMRAWGAVYH